MSVTNAPACVVQMENKMELLSDWSRTIAYLRHQAGTFGN